MPMQQLLRMGRGAVIPLDTKETDELWILAAGHPIAAGSAGENVTVRGLDWADVRPGTRLRMGTVLCEISAWALPCKHNARWFADGDFNRMHHERGPVSRAYATVLEPGGIRTGDPAVLH